MSTTPFLSKVVLKNYKSIARCNVELKPLTILVGRNGAGKSNFLDALRFVADALRNSLDHALRDRGGINEIRRRSRGHPTHLQIRLHFNLPEGVTGHYEFRIGARPEGGYEVQKEECRVYGTGSSLAGEYFVVERGEVLQTSIRPAPKAVTDRLYLVNASGLEPFRPVYEALSRMGFYNLSPEEMRELQAPHSGDLLEREGWNITSVLSRLNSSPQKSLIEKYLAQVVPGIQDVGVKVLGPRETLEFRQEVAGSKDPWRFLAANMSDGTLRVLGILVALFQTGNGSSLRVPLVGIEEPEAALHPAAAGVLLDSLRDASQNTQVLITTHSPDLLDDKDIDVDSILAVVAREGVTGIAPLNRYGKEVIRDHLYTAGELLRRDELNPDPEILEQTAGQQFQLEFPAEEDAA